jgi:sacsin
LNNYVIFDPLCKHFPELLDSNPGFRIPFDINHVDNLFNQYEDVIQAFKGDFETISQLSNGTMFRFPLRVKASQIHERVFSPLEVEHEIRNKSDELKNTMIFLKNISKLVFKKINSTGEIETIFDFEKQFFEKKDEIEHSDFMKYFKSSSHLTFMQIAKKNFYYELRIKDLMKNESMGFHIINQIGFENKQLSLNDSSKYFPLGSIAIPIDKQENFNGYLYCFLPLPIPSPMPYHINGYFVLANESRQALFKMSDIENDGFKWNKHIFNEIISNLILEGIIYMRQKVEVKFKEAPELMEKSYLNYFPALETNKKILDSTIYMDEMQTNAYKKIFSSNAALIPIYSNNNQTVEWVKYQGSKFNV